MKKENKEKLQLKRKKDTQIIRTISKEQIDSLKAFNKSMFFDNEVSKEEMVQCLETLINIIVNSSYLDEVTRMTQNYVSNKWNGSKVDSNFIKDILMTELKSTENASNESVALKLCYWSNRIAHHIENEVLGKEKNIK